MDIYLPPRPVGGSLEMAARGSEFPLESQELTKIKHNQTQRRGTSLGRDIAIE